MAGPVDALILAGGAARRLGGVDKPAVPLGDSSLLDRVVTAVGVAERIVVVGPPRPVSRDAVWCQEEPPGGGPVAAIAAGLPHVAADIVLLLAADLPWIAPAVGALTAGLDADPEADCAVLTAHGRRNYLAAAWRTPALRVRVDALATVAGTAARELYAHATVVEVVDDDAGTDCDTWPEIETARERLLHRPSPGGAP